MCLSLEWFKSDIAIAATIKKALRRKSLDNKVSEDKVEGKTNIMFLTEWLLLNTRCIVGKEVRDKSDGISVFLSRLS